MNYVSTRGATEPMAFQDALLTGLAPDGGLLVPDALPTLDPATLPDTSYAALATAVMQPFVDIEPATFPGLVEAAYSGFDHEAVTPLVAVGDVNVLELFHGPTLAFKDVALQFLGTCFSHVLEARDTQLNILAATSGDTGSAGIYAVRGKPRLEIFVMYPRGRVSPLQELQMTTVLDRNVHPVCVDGTFDDCQQIMKATFGDADFKAQWHLGAINSVNWARILAQVVYYFSAWQQLGKPAEVDFAVPTGNFGNIFAGLVAAKMGLPVGRLVLATNENDILARYFQTGVYARGEVHQTPSPAMDIQVSSNFERYLFGHFGGDGERVASVMAEFGEKGSVDIGLQSEDASRFVAAPANEAETLAAIRSNWNEHEYLMDPHTAVGCHVAARYRRDVPMVVLATAHPAKFPEAIDKVLPAGLARHPALDRLTSMESRHDEVPADEAAVRNLIRDYLA